MNLSIAFIFIFTINSLLVVVNGNNNDNFVPNPEEGGYFEGDIMGVVYL